MMKKHCTAIVLAGGRGSRMGTKVAKQYLEIGGKPLIYYSLHTFQESHIIDDIILVAGEGQESYVRTEIVEAYGFSKVSAIVTGGKERYDSVWSGLSELAGRDNIAEDGMVFIHDCARPFVEEVMLKRAYEAVEMFDACVVGMPSKDTVKIADENAFIAETPNRNLVWIIQTPQVFKASLIIEAYSKLMRGNCIGVTDDAMVVEREMGLPVRLVEGSYENIKVTTLEDLAVAEIFLQRKMK